MSKEQPKTIPTFYALGALTNFEIWVAPSLPTLVSSVTGDVEYLSRDSTGRREVRERFACSLATETPGGVDPNGRERGDLELGGGIAA